MTIGFYLYLGLLMEILALDSCISCWWLPTLQGKKLLSSCFSVFTGEILVGQFCGHQCSNTGSYLEPRAHSSLRLLQHRSWTKFDTALGYLLLRWTHSPRLLWPATDDAVLSGTLDDWVQVSTSTGANRESLLLGTRTKTVMNFTNLTPSSKTQSCEFAPLVLQSWKS